MSHNKHVNNILTEAYEVFDGQGVSIIGEGYKEIATNAALLEAYIGALTEGITSPDTAAQVAQIMANTNHGILRESSAGIAPIASLSMPVIRKLWPKFAIKEAIKTEVTKVPMFVVSYTKPYLFRGNGSGEEERIDLPIKNFEGNPLLAQAGRAKHRLAPVTAVAPSAAGAVVVPAGAADLSGHVIAQENSLTNVVFNTKLTNNETGSAIKTQPLADIRVAAIEVGTIDGTTPFDFAPAADQVVKVPVNRLDVTQTLSFNVDYTVGTDSYTGEVLVRVDLAKATAKVIVAGFSHDVKVVLEAYVSDEYNEKTWSVGYDIARHDIKVPTGIHLNAPLPIEELNDAMALYEIDGAAEVTDLMTNVFAQNLDMELLEFLFDAHDNQPGHQEFQGYPEHAEYELTFDVRPAAGFAGSPKAWREELKPQIDYLASKIKANTYLQAGVFSIVGHPLDVQLISNVEWAFRGGQGGGVDGVDVDYAQGTFVGANTYRVIASPNARQGELLILFTPTTNKQMTYKYYPYTFSVERGYIDPNRSRVPSIMMTKRHTYAEFLPAIGIINIINNTGQGQFNTGDVWTRTA